MRCVSPWGDPGPRKRCRLAWLELLMFCKACLEMLPGGAAKRRRNHNISANRLERWAVGERRSLWDEVVAGVSCRQAVGFGAMKSGSRRRDCVRSSTGCPPWSFASL